eukprot:TRINITY_DN44143_c0_g1_i1.p1 TRINITY_DN44143_c0_g1~~TRINITY_DN44143_c0_g1_i1.p1  ORF type:complete len:461 (+),score=50.87 TRINITY_DN44143_c0_g1_i1:72-1454(+)
MPGAMQYGTMQDVESSGTTSNDTPASAGRWRTLAAVSLNSALNAALCMFFSCVEEHAKVALDVEGTAVADLYSVWLLTTLLGLAPALWLLDRYEGTALYLGTLATVASAWQRWFGLIYGHGYIAGVVSQVLCGMGAWIVFTLPGQVSHKRFPRHEQALATGLMLQSNYFGWLLGSALPPLVVDDKTSLLYVARAEAWIASVVGVAILLLYKPWSGQAAHPADVKQAVEQDARVDTSADAATHQGTNSEAMPGHSAAEDSGFAQMLSVVCSHPLFGVQVVCYGVLGGVSFASPSAMFFMIDELNLPDTVAAAANAAFIGCGVLSGTLFGYYFKEPHTFGPTLKTCFAGCALALSGCALQVHFGFLKYSPSSIALLLGLSAIAGATSLGFIGIAIEALCLYRVQASYVCCSVESLVLICAAVLSHLATSESGFMILGVTATACMLPILFSSQQPPPQHVDRH